MSGLIDVFTSFLSQIVNLDIFVYLIAAFAFFGVIQLFRKAVYT